MGGYESGSKKRRKVKVYAVSGLSIGMLLYASE